MKFTDSERFESFESCFMEFTDLDGSIRVASFAHFESFESCFMEFTDLDGSIKVASFAHFESFESFESLRVGYYNEGMALE